MHKADSNTNHEVEKKHAKKVFKRWHSEDLKLCNRLQGLTTEYKSKLNGIDCESVKVRKQAENLITEQIRLADTDSEAEQKLRAELGLKRRESMIRVHEAVHAADRFGLPLANNRRHSIQHTQHPVPSRKTSIPSLPSSRKLSISGSYSPATFNKTKSRRHSVVYASESRRHSVYGSESKESKGRVTFGIQKDSNNSELGTIQTSPDEEDNDYIEIPAITVKTQSQPRNKNEGPCNTGQASTKTRRQRARSVKELKRDSLGHRLVLPLNGTNSVVQQSDKNDKDQSSILYEEMANCRYLRLRGQEDKELTPDEVFGKGHK